MQLFKLSGILASERAGRAGRAGRIYYMGS